MHDLLHRGLDRQGGIQRDVVSHVRREPRLGVLENLLHVVRGFDRVGARARGKCRWRPQATVVQSRAQVVGLRAQFHAADVLDLHLRAVRVGADDDFLELLGILEQPEGADVELAFLARRRGLGPDAAGGRLGVLLLDGVLDVLGVMPSDASLSGRSQMRME